MNDGSGDDPGAPGDQGTSSSAGSKAGRESFRKPRPHVAGNPASLEPIGARSRRGNEPASERRNARDLDRRFESSFRELPHEREGELALFLEGKRLEIPTLPPSQVAWTTRDKLAGAAPSDKPILDGIRRATNPENIGVSGTPPIDKRHRLDSTRKKLRNAALTGVVLWAAAANAFWPVVSTSSSTGGDEVRGPPGVTLELETPSPASSEFRTRGHGGEHDPVPVDPVSEMIIAEIEAIADGSRTQPRRQQGGKPGVV